MGGDHAVGALTLALEVRTVIGRTLLLGGEFGLEALNARLECDDDIGDRPVTAGGSHGQGLMPDLFQVDRGQGLAIIAARARQAMAPDDGARGFGRDAEAFGDLSVGELFDRHD